MEYSKQNMHKHLVRISQMSLHKRGETLVIRLDFFQGAQEVTVSA